jgi:hypothetical protein
MTNLELGSLGWVILRESKSKKNIAFQSSINPILKDKIEKENQCKEEEEEEKANINSG